MNENWTGAIGLIIGAGVLQGSFALPLKYARKWNWENTWLSYSILAYLILPWLIAFLTVPQLKQILQQTSTLTLVGTVLFGLGWGVGCLTFGLGIDYLGLSLGFAITLGLTTALGTLIPLLMLSPDRLMSRQGGILVLGIVTMLAGISLCSWAGKLKDGELRSASEGADHPSRRSYSLGLLLCILSGVFSACANLGFAFGAKVTSLATRWGTPQRYASIPLWSVMMLPLFLCNASFCFYLLFKHRSMDRFLVPRTHHYHFLTGSMAVMWLVGMFIYGFAANKLGPAGISTGWAILMSSIVIVANLWGLTTREWRGTSLRVKRNMSLGLFVLVVAIFIIAGAQ